MAKPERFALEMRFTLDDGFPLTISYPPDLSDAEYVDVCDLVALWLRQLHRSIVVPVEPVSSARKEEV